MNERGMFMKICPKCGFENVDADTFCAKCSAALLGQSVQQGESGDFFQREERREKIKRWTRLSLIPLYYLIYLPFYVGAVKIDRELWLMLGLPLLIPLLYYLFYFKPETMFRLQHLFEIDNLDEVQVSDWYLFTSKLSAYFLWIFGIAVVIITYVGLK